MTTTARPRALDVATGVGAAYAARLLAEVGWDVVKVEPPGGDPLRWRPSRWGGTAGGAFAFANHGKRGILAEEGEIRVLAAAADVVIGDFSAAGCAEAELSAALFEELEPRLAVVSLSPFGLTGPRAHWAASDLVVQAMSGLLFLTGEYDQPPMQLPPYAAATTGGVAAAGAAMAAVRSARSSGERIRVDVSMLEALASFTYGATTAYVTRGEVLRREQRVKQALRMVPASDRFIYCAAGAVANMPMDGIARLLEEPRLAEERFATAEGRMRHWHEYVDLFVPPFRRRSAQEWFEAAERLHLTFALVQSIDDLFGCPQLSARGAWSDAITAAGRTVRIPSRPFRTEGGPPRARRPAPMPPGEHDDEVRREWLGSPVTLRPGRQT